MRRPVCVGERRVVPPRSLLRAMTRKAPRCIRILGIRRLRRSRRIPRIRIQRGAFLVMARNNDRGGTTRRSPKDTGRRIKKKPCALCKDRVEWVDYKDVGMLRKYMSDRGKIRARRVSGNCTQHQRDVAIAIKTARELVLLPYTQRTTTERPGGRWWCAACTGAE